MASTMTNSGVLSSDKQLLRQTNNYYVVRATMCFILFAIFIFSDYINDAYFGHSRSRYYLRGTPLSKSDEFTFGGVLHGGYFSVQDSKIMNENRFRFAAITDLDQLSLTIDGKSRNYRSYLSPGTITFNKNSNLYTMEMEPTSSTRTLTTKHNEDGRGAEFSELSVFDGRLLTFDDRTGDVFEILNSKDGTNSFVAPRYVISGGEGDTDKGMKLEWSTEKDDVLYMGSHGTEYTSTDYTNFDGSDAIMNNLWVTVMNKHGEFRRIDWTDQYNFVQNALGCPPSGYVTHEAINWSHHMRKWIFMPRRISNEPYDEVLDEKRGSNKLVIVNESFTKAEVVEVNLSIKNGLHGFSSFAFVPGTMDRHAIALRSVEEDCAGEDLDSCKQRSYIVIFDVLTGEVLMDEVKIEENMKYEGIEFVDIYTKPF